MENSKKYVVNIVYIIAVISLIALGFFIILNNLFPLHIRNILFLIFLSIYVIFGFIILKNNNKSKAISIFMTVIFSILIIVQTMGCYYIFNTYTKYNRSLRQAGESVKYTIITLKTNEVNTVKEMKNSDLYYSKEDGFDGIKKMKAEIVNINDKINFIQNDSTLTNYKNLLDGKIKYMILNNSLIGTLEPTEEEFRNKVKEVLLEDNNTSVTVKKEKDIKKDTKPEQSFVIYISGGDSYESTKIPSRSDVNILLAVNPKTNKMLMTTISRDAYVMMPGLGRDKLTHAGIYGIDKSIDTLENLLDIDINYYAKVNFASLIDLVDIMGGIKVNNKQDFVSRLGKNHYPKGEIELNGEKALDFVRERYHLKDGDNDRARNQMLVLEAMIRKSMSPTILLKYNQVLDKALESVNTNMPAKILTSIVNNQIETKAGWQISHNEIKGSGQMGLKSFAMPHAKLFMYKLDKTSVFEASNMIKSLLAE